MRIIGLTGGLGSGKSTVSRMLRELGATVIDADEGARAVVEEDQPGFEEVVAAFGDRVLDSHGHLDRAALADIVFTDEAARRKLEAITHPRVREWMASKVAEAEAEGKALLILDIPLLFESGLQAGLDGVIVVWSTAEQQLQRAIERGGRRADMEARIAAQMPLDQKRERATYAIDNSGTVEATQRQVAALWAKLCPPT